MNGSDVPVLSGALAHSLRSASQGGWAEVLLIVHHLDVIMSYVRNITRCGRRSEFVLRSREQKFLRRPVAPQGLTRTHYICIILWVEPQRSRAEALQSVRPITRSGFRPYIFRFRHIGASGKCKHLK